MPSLIVSFCNQRWLADGLVVGRPNGNIMLAKVDLVEQRITPVAFHHRNDHMFLGATGLSRDMDRYATVIQGVNMVVLMDPDLVPREFLYMPIAADPHGIVLQGGHLQVVSSGRNRIMQVDLEKKEYTDYWVALQEEEDKIHLNSLLFYQDRVLVSAFGPRDPQGRWVDARSGFVMDIGSGDLLMSDLSHPHSLIEDEGRFLVCESKRGLVRDSSGGVLEVGGFVRGLAASEDSLFVGTSEFRTWSRSLGPNVYSGHEVGREGRGRQADRASIVVYQKAGNNLQDYRRMFSIDMSMHAQEIFDILYVS